MTVRMDGDYWAEQRYEALLYAKQQTEQDEESLGPCGCVDYHLADCPTRSTDMGPSTKGEWLDILTDDDLY